MYKTKTGLHVNNLHILAMLFVIYGVMKWYGL